MGHRATTWAFDQDIPSTPKFVLVALASHADDRGLCWPSVARLMQHTGLKERAVRNALRELEQRGLVATERRDGFLSRYTLSLEGASEVVAAAPDALVTAVDAGEGGHDVQGGTTCRGASGASLPGTTCLPPRHLVQGTPAPRAPEPSRTSNQPSLNGQPRAGRAANEPGAEFEEFWRLYPRKVGKGQAKKAWLTAVRKVAGDAELILIGLKARLHTFSPAPPEGVTDYRRHPATWLNGEGWLDDEEPEPARVAPPSLAVH